MLGAEGDFEKLFEAFADIVGEPVAIEQRDDVVFIWRRSARESAGDSRRPFRLDWQDQSGSSSE